MTDEQTTTKTKDESQDQKYFTITPRLVWALSRNPYDFTLWSTIKGIAGESGECFLATGDLALLAMMSMGQVYASRKYLQDVGLLKGDKRRDPGYPQEVWHLSIPNIWEANLKWAEKYASLKDRVEFKRQQAEKIQAERKAVHQVKDDVELSPGESLLSPGEKGYAPGETKNIHKENQKEELGASAPKSSKPTPPPAGAGMDWVLNYLNSGGDPSVLQAPTDEEVQNAKLVNALELFQPAYTPYAKAFILATGIFPIKGDEGGWMKAFRDQKARTGLTPEDVDAACKQMYRDGLTIKDPFSVMGVAGNIHGDRTRKSASAPAAAVDTPLTRAQAKWSGSQRPPRPTT